MRSSIGADGGTKPDWLESMTETSSILHTEQWKDYRATPYGEWRPITLSASCMRRSSALKAGKGPNPKKKVPLKRHQGLKPDGIVGIGAIAVRFATDST